MPPNGRAKLDDVAARAGVSRATVSQVMRGTGRISTETRARVSAAAAALDYVPDGRAAAMRSGLNREVGMVIHRIANPFNAEVVGGVTDALEQHGYLVSVLDSRDDPQRQERNLRALIASSRGALLWVPALDTPAETIEMVRRRGLATVTLLRDLPEGPAGRRFDHLGIRNAAATRHATEHLIALGHRRFAFFGGVAQNQVRAERVRGCREALAEHGLDPPLLWPCEDEKPAGMAAALELRRRHPDVTALVCNGDMVALGASQAFQRLGLRPGRDVSIVGFDGTPDAEVSVPALTTLSVRPRHVGERLARILLARIENPGTEPKVRHMTAKLDVRQTTGPAPQP